MTSLLALSVLALQDKTYALAPSSYKDIEGAEVALPSKEAKATVLLFIAVDCPISNRYAPEMGRLYNDFSPRGVSFVRIYLDDSVPTADILQHGKDFKMPSHAILDAKHVMVKQLGMTVTPEVAVVDPGGTLLYRGRINDLYIEHGRLRDGQIKQDLRIALDEVLAGKKVTTPFTIAIGCGIPDE
ncbi:MAG: redoxin domain-containing protein [Armatimonadetes bacterium]|nr:redoxin domain-containing protein [Armatimonadota bacterium]